MVQNVIKLTLASAVAVSFLFGCGNNREATHLYQLEKLFYDAQRAEAEVTIDPAGPGEADRRRLAAKYAEVSQYYRRAMAVFNTETDPATAKVAEGIAVRAILREAMILRTTKQYERSLEIYRSIPTDFPLSVPSHSLARFELAQTYERLGQWDSAVVAYHRLMYAHHPPRDTVYSFDMDWLRIPLHVIEGYGSLEQPDKVSAWVDTCLTYYRQVAAEYQSGTVNTLAKTHLASAFRLKDDVRAAIDVYRTITDESGRILPQAQVEIGDLFYEKLRQPDSALAVLKTLVAQRPDSPPATIAQTRIAAIYIDRDQYQAARDLLRPLKKAFEKKGQIVAGVLLLLGRSYEKEGAWDRALNEYSWLVENFPDLKQSWDTYLHVIARMVKAENPTVARQWQKKARRHFENAIERDPQTEQAAMAQTYLARSYIMLTDWAEAARAYQELIDNYPPVPARLRNYLELSSIYAERLNNREKGATVLEKLLADFPDLRVKVQIQERIATLRSPQS